ncbi:MAG: hypothetical protein Q9203_006987, partial [Teloschistes exilis]
MAHIQDARHNTYRNDSITADIVQQGSGNAGRDIYNVPITVLHARQPKPPPSSTVPFRRDDDFISRDSLDKRNANADNLRRKSQIAIEYAYQVQEESPTTWVFWIHAATRARFEEGYRRIVQATKMDGWDNPKADILSLVRSWLCDKSNGRWVMVVDNADDLAVFFPLLSRAKAVEVGNPGQAAEPLSDFLPQSPNGSILITSRSRDVARRLTGRGDCLVEVKPMDKGEALALLQKKLSFNASEHNAIELLEALDQMPLAITQAAAYIEHRAPRMTISRYIDEVRRKDHDRALLLMKDMGDDRRDGRASNSIIATWQISFAHIRKAMPTAARLLSLMSLFDRQGIPESLLHDRYWRDDGKEANFEDDIHTLTSFSLVEISADGHEFEMHRLVQFSTKKWLELYDELEEWKEAYITLMDNSYPVGRHKNWAVCQALFLHAQAVVACRPAGRRRVEAWASVLFKAAWYATEMGKYKEAKEMFQDALEAQEAALGAEHPATLASVSNLALVLRSQGKYKQAEDMTRRALEGSEKALGKENPDTLTSVSILASVLRSQGKYEQAEDMIRRALEGREKALGKEHPNTLTSVSDLASVLQSQGKYEQAEDMTRRVLEGYEKALGKEHPDTLTSVYCLAYLLQQRKQYEDASLLYQRACAGYQEKLGLDHPTTQACMDHYSLLQRLRALQASGSK